MGLLWRLLAPRPLKKARRAMHPGWVIEDAIVRSARGGGHRRAQPKAQTYTAALQITSTDDGRVRELSCPHAHQSPGPAQECGQKMWREWHRDHPEDMLVGQ